MNFSLSLALVERVKQSFRQEPIERRCSRGVSPCPLAPTLSEICVCIIIFDTCAIIEKIAVWRLRSLSCCWVRVFICSVLRRKRAGVVQCVLMLLFARAHQKNRNASFVSRRTLNERGTSLACEMRIRIYIHDAHCAGARAQMGCDLGHWLNGKGKWATNIVINRGFSTSWLLEGWLDESANKWG